MPTKTPSIVSTILTVILLILFGIASMFFLVVALNGFSTSEGGPALITSLVCNVIGIIATAILAWGTLYFAAPVASLVLLQQRDPWIFFLLLAIVWLGDTAAYYVGKFNWNSIVAVIVSVLAGLFVGGGLSAIALFIGVLVADSLWNAR